MRGVTVLSTLARIDVLLVVVTALPLNGIGNPGAPSGPKPATFWPFRKSTEARFLELIMWSTRALPLSQGERVVPVSVKKFSTGSPKALRPVVLGTISLGNKVRKRVATGLKRLCGILFPGKSVRTYPEPFGFGTVLAVS